MKRSTGYYETCSTAGESFKAFIPSPLPPTPPLEWTPKLHSLMEKANQAVGRLDGLSHSLPDVSIFLYSYIRKEAILSSQIEGTQSSFSDLLKFEDKETPGVPLDDVQEVSNYVAAMNHGLKRLKDGFPLSLRLIKEIHEILLTKGRGSTKMPGEFRRSQNWVGGSRPGNASYVPPPPNAVLACLGDLEKFLHQPKESVPVLVKAALSHVQFETIHPFLDGNGRLGRLLITLLLCVEEVLTEPILYLSLYFKTHRTEYYERLSAVRAKGDWEGWLEFFLKGVSDTAETASESARQILRLFDKDQASIAKLGRASESALRVHHFMRKRPLVSIATIAEGLKMTFPTVNTSLKHLVNLDIVEESTGRKRSRLFTYTAFLEILNKGTEPILFSDFGNIQTKLEPVFFHLGKRFKSMKFPISKQDYRWHIDSMSDTLVLWVDQKNGLQTSKQPIEIEYSFLMDGGFLTENGIYLKGIEVAFDRWIPLIKAFKNKKITSSSKPKKKNA